MKADALGALKRAPSNPENNPIEEQHVVSLAVRHIERFFRELAVAVSEIRNSAGQSGRN
jgi:hypothetical protein